MKWKIKYRADGVPSVETEVCETCQYFKNELDIERDLSYHRMNLARLKADGARIDATMFVMAALLVGFCLGHIFW